MSRLILVRHGQASFLSEDYDRLSPVGKNQSRLLGEWFVRHGYRIDRAYAGPRRRHIETAQAAAEGAAAAGGGHPDAAPMPDLDECRTDLHLDRLVPDLRDRFPHLEDLGAAFSAAASDADRRKSFQRLFDAVMRLYIHDRFALAELETWGAFLARVAGAIRAMTSEAPAGSTIAAYTSGGTISAAMHYVLGTDPDRTLEFMWQGRNAALTEFVFSGDRISLVSFNATPHLDDPALWTHR